MSIEIIIKDRSNVVFPIVIKDKNGNEIYYQNSDGYYYERTYSNTHCPLTYKNSNGDWTETTYDEDDNVLTYKKSDGFWAESTYGDDANELTYKDSDGRYKINGKKVTKEKFQLFITQLI
jgi:hypothetical protein